MGGTYGRVPHHLPTFESCKWACQQTTACVGAVFVRDAAGHNCALKSAMGLAGTGTWNSHTDAWHRFVPSVGNPDNGPWIQGREERNTDYGGNDLNMGGQYGRVPHHLATFENCKWACRQ